MQQFSPRRKPKYGLPWWPRGQRVCIQYRRSRFYSRIWEDPLENGMGNNHSILAWRMDKGVWLGSMRPQIIRNNRPTNTLNTSLCMLQNPRINIKLEDTLPQKRRMFEMKTYEQKFCIRDYYQITPSGNVQLSSVQSLSHV